jgi:hypothetical protein
MKELFSGASMGWFGTNLLGASDRQRQDYRRHLDEAILPALAASAVSAHRLEKMIQSPRRSFGPDFLSVCEFAVSPAPVLPDERPTDAWANVFEPMWRMSWRKIFDTGPASVPPVRVRLIALSPPADATDAEVAEWNRFYSEVHVGEAMLRRRWTRATRWTLERSDLHPNPGCPRYFVLYEAAGFKDVPEDEVAAVGPWTPGPPIWKRQVGTWTLDYRVVPAAI